jgi:small subunit ribosomal protein S7e
VAPAPVYHFIFCYHFRLTRELEKKFSDRHVVFVAQRRILRKPTRNSRVKQKRPRSRTLTDVHEKILEDLVFPTEIVGKRTRINQDGSKLLKVWVPADLSSSIPVFVSTIPIGCSRDIWYI